MIPATVILVFNILLFLFPGFLALKIREALTTVARTSDFSRMVDAFLFTVGDYALYLIPAKFFNLELTIISVARQQGESVGVSTPEISTLLWQIVIAIALGLISGMGSEKDWFYKLKTRKFLGIGPLTTRPNSLDAWADAFKEIKGRWILVQLKDGTKVLGWPARSSDEAERRQLFLADAVIKWPDGSERQVEGPGILLTEKSEIISIEFLP